MREVYVDSEYRCHVANDGTMAAVQTGFFDGKCDAFIQGFRFVPQGKSWTREDGTVFEGPMITPWKDSRILEAAQKQYEENAAQIAEMETAMKILFEGEEL